MSISTRIKNRRKELKMSVDELAAKLNINRATIYRYESADIENLSINILKPLADALNTTPAYLMGWEDLGNIEIPEKDLHQHQHIFDKIHDFSDDEVNELSMYINFIKSKRKGN